MCIPKSEDHSLEIAFLREKKISLIAVFLHCLRMPYIPTMCLIKFTPILSPPVPPYPPDYFSPKLHVLFFFPLGLLSAACVRTGEGPCSRSRGRSLGARMLEESWPSLYQQPSTEGLQMAKKYGDCVGLLSFFFFLRVNILSPEENVN